MDPLEALMKLRKKRKMLAIGLMSGTSVDGVSAVLVEIEGHWLRTKFRIIHHKTYPYEEELRRQIFSLFDSEKGTVDKICLMNFILGEVFAEAAIKISEEAGVDIDKVDFIASHGQTVYHMPKISEVAGYRSRATLQIGEPSVIAERTGVLTIADFRPRDVAAGGEGAPISAYADYILFRSNLFSRAIQNIGGIANVTYIPKGGSIEEVIAFDTGPGNMLIDYAVQYFTKGKLSYDKDGSLASKGKVSVKLLN